MRHPLLTASAAFDRSAILRRAWSKAKASFASCNRLGLGRTLRECFAADLRFVWDEARSARALAIWAAEQEAVRKAFATLDARTREIAELQFSRAAAIGIDDTREHFATVRRIDARLLELRA